MFPYRALKTLLAPALLAAALTSTPLLAADVEDVEVELSEAGEAFVQGCSEGGHYSESACVCLVSHLIEDGVTVEDLNHIDLDQYAEVLNDCKDVND
jgi:hypothetical protein